MKVVFLVVLCCLLGMEVKVISAGVFDDAVKALVPYSCKTRSLASINPISYDNLPAPLIFEGRFRCRDGKIQKCQFDGVVDYRKHIKKIKIACNGSLGTYERSNVTVEDTSASDAFRMLQPCPCSC